MAKKSNNDQQPRMTADEFKAAQHELGLDDDDFAKEIGLKSGRGVRGYKYRERPVSGPVARLVTLLVAQHREKGQSLSASEK